MTYTELTFNIPAAPKFAEQFNGKMSTYHIYIYVIRKL
jgi:hypothetical protein